MGTCDVCGVMASYKEGTVYTADEFREIVSKGFGSHENFKILMNLYGVTKQQAFAQWKDDLVRKSVTDWMLCPSCAEKAARYMPMPAGTGPRSENMVEEITPELVKAESTEPTKINENDNVERIRIVAERGDARAQNHVGNMFHYGNGVSQDYSEALRWYRRAAEQGYDKAQYNLGNMYNYGKGVSKDPVAAVRWYLRAADQGSAESQFNLGGAYFFGNGVSQDYSEALRWYRRAAEQGYDKAQRSVALMIKKGLGVSRGNKEATVPRIAADLLTLKSRISNLPEEYPAIGESFGPGAGVAKQQIPIICQNIEQAFVALQTGLDPNNNPISKEQIEEGLINLANATKKPEFSGLLNTVLSVRGVIKLESYMDQLGVVADQLRQLHS